jgi:hypothetical protein
MKRRKKFMNSGFMESAIMGVSGLVAITLCGVILYVTGLVFSLSYLTIPFTAEILMLVEFPLFFVFGTIIKVLIGGKLIELSVRYISKLLGIKRIIIAPDKPIIIIKKKRPVGADKP